MARHATAKRPLLRKSSNAENLPVSASPRTKHVPGRVASVTFFPDDSIRASSRARRQRALKPRQRSFAKPTLHVSEARDAAPSKPAQTKASKSTTSASLAEQKLPRRLARPAFREVSRAVLTAIDPALEELPFDFIRQGLAKRGADMLKVLPNVHATPARHVLPKELSVLVHNLASHAPTHMLAVYAPGQAPRRTVTLFPVHDIIFAAHCAALPPLPPSNVLAQLAAQDAAAAAETTAQADAGAPVESPAPYNLTLPVVPLPLPHPASLPALSAFLYTQRADQLLAALLPPLPPALSRPAPAQYARALAETYTQRALAAHALRVTGAWRNACALGIHDDVFWRVLAAAWEVVLAALAMSVGRPVEEITRPVGLERA